MVVWLLPPPVEVRYQPGSGFRITDASMRLSNFRIADRCFFLRRQGYLLRIVVDLVQSPIAERAPPTFTTSTSAARFPVIVRGLDMGFCSFDWRCYLSLVGYWQLSQPNSSMGSVGRSYSSSAIALARMVMRSGRKPDQLVEAVSTTGTCRCPSGLTCARAVSSSERFTTV